MLFVHGKLLLLRRGCSALLSEICAVTLKSCKEDIFCLQGRSIKNQLDSNFPPLEGAERNTACMMWVAFTPNFLPFLNTFLLYNTRGLFIAQSCSAPPTRGLMLPLPAVYTVQTRSGRPA